MNMNILKENIDSLNAVIKISLTPEDYKPKVDQVIRKYQKTANVPGFRPGMVPAGMIRKMYGKAILVEELNNILSESLGKYIFENKLDVIGNPLPVKSETEQVFEEGRNFEFGYEVGIAPEIEVVMPKKKLPYYLVKIDDKMVEDDMNDMRRRYGKFSNPETSDVHSILYGEFNELDADQQIKEGGNKTTTTISIEMIRDAEAQKPFIGLKKGDTVNFNPLKTMKNEAEAAAMLKVDKSPDAINSDYQFTVMTVNLVEKAELTQEFFDKIYGEGIVTSEDEFREKIRSGISQYFEKESDRKLKKDLRMKLLEEMNVPLPDDFLKRMLKENNKEKTADEHAFEHEYYHLSEDLRWNLVTGKIAKDNQIEAAPEEVKAVAAQMIRQQFAGYGMYDMTEQKLDEYVNRYLAEDNSREKIERSVIDQKVFEFIKPQLKLDMTELPYDEFVKKLNEKTEHELEHH